MTATPFLFRWRDAVASAHGPDSPTTRHVLLTLSLDADQDGGSCYPSTRRLATRTGLSRTCVMSHLDAAEVAGWIRRRPVGTDRGQGWKRTVYDLLIPPEVVNEVHHVGGQRRLPRSEEGGQPHEQGGQPDGVKVVNEVDLISSIDLSNTSAHDGVSDQEDRTHRFPPPSALPKANGQYSYPAEFEAAWAVYPSRAGGNPKKAAYRQWRARAKNGATPSELLEGAERYARFVRATGKEGTEFVQQARTFYGPDEHYAEPWEAPAGESGHSPYGGRLR